MAKREDIQPLSLGHQHPDNLAYLFIRGGEYFTCDDGYNRNIMPDNHNVLLVDGAYTDAADVSDVHMHSIRQRLEADPSYDPQRYGGRVTAVEVQGSLVLYRGETAGVYPLEQEMDEVSRLLVTDGLKFWVLVDVLHSRKPHVYAALCNTESKAVPTGDAFRYPLETGELRLQVFSDKLTQVRQYQQQVAAVMTPQEPDKLTRTTIQTLRVESAKAERDQVFFQCFTFSDSAAEVTAQGRSLTVTHEGQIYRVDVGAYDPQAGKTPITVSVQGKERMDFEV